jgi:hypothetical protein
MFKIGGEVVVIKDHSQGVVKKGQRFIVKDIMEFSCGHSVAVDLGLRANKVVSKCTKCGMHEYTGEVFWIGTDILRPVEDDFATLTLERILRQAKREEKILIEQI